MDPDPDRPRRTRTRTDPARTQTDPDPDGDQPQGDGQTFQLIVRAQEELGTVVAGVAFDLLDDHLGAGHPKPPPPAAASPQAQLAGAVRVGLYPIVTSQCSSTALYQVSYHIQ